jgi:hypothetical protein
LERRFLILPIAWALYGLGEVFALTYLLGPIASLPPIGANDKPIGGSVLPVLFFNVVAIISIILTTLYSVGFWTPNLSTRQSKIELAAVVIVLGSGFLLWYNAIFLFTAVGGLVALMAINVQ